MFGVWSVEIGAVVIRYAQTIIIIGAKLPETPRSTIKLLIKYNRYAIILLVIYMKKTGTKRIKTERLVLRKFRVSDYFSVQKWYCDERTAYYSEGSLKKSKKECCGLIKGIIYGYIKKKNNYYNWAISLNGKAIGFIEIRNMQKENEYFVYYMVSPEHWGKGYATESCRAALDYMKTQGASVIFAGCDSNNRPSFCVLEKSGFKRIQKNENIYHYRDGRTGDRELFAIRLNNG